MARSEQEAFPRVQTFPTVSISPARGMLLRASQNQGLAKYRPFGDRWLRSMRGNKSYIKLAL
jgi:hypothetical protein